MFGTRYAATFESDRCTSNMETHTEQLTVESVIYAFLDFADSDYLSRHPKNLRSGLMKLCAMFGNLPASEFRALRFRQWRDALVEGNLSERLLSRKYINRLTKYVCQAWAWAVSMEMVAPDSLAALKSVPALRAGRTTAPETEPVKPVEPERVIALLPHLSKPMAAILELLRLTGARTGEIRTMIQGEIDMTRDCWIYAPGSHKTAHHGKQRVIPLDEPCQRVLLPWMRPFIPDAIVFENPRTGKCYGKDSLYNAVQRACARSGIETFHPHQIRHQVLGEVRRSGDLDAAQGLAGHASRSTTEAYAPVDFEAAMRGQRLLRGAPAP